MLLVFPRLVSFKAAANLRNSHACTMNSGYEDKYVLMLAALEQDYEELQTETEEVASLLQKAKENKLRLKAEIKFLKKRASLLRGSIRVADQYSTREPVLESDQYLFGSSRASAGRMVLGDFQSRSLNSQPLNPPGRVSSNLASSSNHRDAVGVLKGSSNQSMNSVPQSKRVAKRKISWQDEFAGRG